MPRDSRLPRSTPKLAALARQAVLPPDSVPWGSLATHRFCFVFAGFSSTNAGLGFAGWVATGRRVRPGVGTRALPMSSGFRRLWTLLSAVSYRPPPKSCLRESGSWWPVLVVEGACTVIGSGVQHTKPLQPFAPSRSGPPPRVSISPVSAGHWRLYRQTHSPDLRVFADYRTTCPGGEWAGSPPAQLLGRPIAATLWVGGGRLL